jgi:3-methyladenine DNA glycosylase Tag
MERTIQRVRQMAHQQRVQCLKDAGILTAAGKLAASYR